MGPYLDELSKELHETVDLSVLKRSHVTFVGQVVAPQRPRAVSAIGTSSPAYSSANGKALLAETPRMIQVQDLHTRRPPATNVATV